jgi:hypothetical protein
MASASNRSSTGPESVLEVDEAVLVSPLGDSGYALGAEQEVGRLPDRKCCLGFVEHFVLGGLNELDVLASLLLEGGDDLPDRLVLLGVIPLLPPHHEVGGLGAERRQDER